MIRGRLHRRDEDSGAIAIMAAVMILAVVVSASLAVDVGRVAYTSRDQQGVTDRAALDALTLVTADSGATSLAELHELVEDEIAGSLGRNPGTDGRTASGREVDLVGLGRVHDGAFEKMCEEAYDQTAAATCTGDVDDPPDGVIDWTVDDVTAVRVVTSSSVSFVFAIGDPGRSIVREAVAESEAVAAISVGSRLVELDLADSIVGDVVDEMLGEMLEIVGVSSYPSLTALGYDGLATTTIPLGDLASLEATLLSPRSVVENVDVSLASMLDVMASAFVEGDPSFEFLTTLAGGVATADAAAGTPFTVDIGQLLWVTTQDEDMAADAQINLWDLLVGSLQVANFQNGLTLTTNVLPESGGQLLGIADLVDVTLVATVVEAPRIAIGPVRSVQEDIDDDGVDEAWWATTARTAQVTLDVELGVGDPGTVFGPYADSLLGSLLDGLLDLLCLFCSDPVESVDISVQGAAAMAGLSGIGCAAPSVTADVVRRPLDAGSVIVDGDSRELYVGLDEVLEAEASTELSLPLLAPSPDWDRDVAVVDPVPGATSVGQATPTSVPVLDALLEPVLAMLGADLGTATVWGEWVDCESRRLAHVQ